MINYLINSFKRKIARRITKEYPNRIDTYQVEGIGEFYFANTQNPLIKPKIFNESSFNFFRKFVKEGDFVIDIGGNFGHLSMHFSLLCGKKGLVLSFEPNPFVYKFLKLNSTLNPNSTNNHVFNYAISTEDDWFYYFSSEASFSNGAISKDIIKDHGKFMLKDKIKGINLENFLKNEYAESLPNLKLIKIDTEGYDKEIIKSITPVLKNYKPIVFTECFNDSNKEDRFEHYNSLASLGYKLFYVSGFEDNAEVIPILTKEDMLKWKHFDLFARID